MKQMGTFYVGCRVANHKDPNKSAVVGKLLVDTGCDFTWLPADTLKACGSTLIRGENNSWLLARLWQPVQ